MLSYLITDPELYSDEPLRFANTLTKALIQYKPDYACFRDKRDGFDKSEIIFEFINICNQNSVKAFINSDIEIADRLGFSGVHLPSSMLGSIKLAKNLGLDVMGSCHNRREIDECVTNEADMITLSPVFASPKKGEPLGVDKFDELLLDVNIKAFALGGIVSQEHIEKLKNSRAIGFASIRYFVD